MRELVSEKDFFFTQKKYFLRSVIMRHKLQNDRWICQQKS